MPANLADFDPFDLMAIEYRRLEQFFEALGPEDWSKPTRLEGWTRRELLCHLAGSEVYHHAGLDDDVEGLLARARAAGFPGMERFNEWMIGSRTGATNAQVLAEWHESGPETIRRLRERAPDGEVATVVGLYPVVLQAFHLAFHAALHAVDLSVPIDPEEMPGRAQWRASFSRFAVPEAGSRALIRPRDGLNHVEMDALEGDLTDDELALAVAGQLHEAHPLQKELRDALHIF